MPEAKPIPSPGPYSNSGDFRRIFSEEIDSLYVLWLLLTADPEKAEQCFVSSLEDSVNGKPVFKECAHSWARRAIIQNAVRIIKPRPMVEIAPSNSDSAKTRPAGQAEIAVVLELERSIALFTSCRFLKPIPMRIVRFSWASRYGT